jgi:hypothetical protein
MSTLDVNRREFLKIAAGSGAVVLRIDTTLALPPPSITLRVAPEPYGGGTVSKGTPEGVVFSLNAGLPPLP